MKKKRCVNQEIDQHTSFMLCKIIELKVARCGFIEDMKII